MTFFSGFDLLEAAFADICKAQFETEEVQSFVNSVNSEARGRLMVCHGPMFAGKTTWLISKTKCVVSAYERDKVLAVRPLRDTRAEEGFFVSHADPKTGEQNKFGPGVIFIEDSEAGAIELISQVFIRDKTVVCIDEAQFFSVFIY